MLEFLLNIGQFALQTLIIVVGLIVIIGFIASLIQKANEEPEISVKSLNKKLASFRRALLKSSLSKKEFKQRSKTEKKSDKDIQSRPRVFVLDFDGDIKASATKNLRKEVSAILMSANSNDKVMIKVESPGGMVHGYGFAASQLQRIRDKGIDLTVCVDKVAASGGYMMASIADRIVAAPYAIIGSIGVVASLPNFNRLLKKNNVDYLEITAGEYKRTLTPLGEVTEPGIKKFKEQIEEVHVLFKDHVKTFREQVDLSQVATGEYWYGQQALKLKLVDELGTSDDWLLKHLDSHLLLEVKAKEKKNFKEKLAESMSLSVDRISDKIWQKLWNQQTINH